MIENAVMIYPGIDPARLTPEALKDGSVSP
jgi:hypothetical protein